MSSELLATVVTCERYRDDFPRGMPLKTCLRRQLEHQEGAKAGKLGPPRRPFCAEECPAGRAHSLAAQAVGVVTSTCPACGAALIDHGGPGCPSCAARRLDAGKDVPRGELPPAGPGQSARLWSGEVPDVPIGAPGENHRRGAAPSRELREAREERAAVRRQELQAEEQDHQEEPAEPAEEQPMACKECESKTVHKGWCSLRPGGPMKGAAGKRPATPASPGGVKASKVTPLRPHQARRAKSPSGAGPDFRKMDLDELLRSRALAAYTIGQVDGEIRRRQQEIAKALDSRTAAAAEG